MNLESTARHAPTAPRPGRLMAAFAGRRGKYLFALGVFVLCFALLFTCMNDAYFDSDEGDVYCGGMLIARGQLVYRDFSSQHMPLMYYIAAVFSLLGASTVYQFRLYFYIFFALMWALNAIWYGDKLNRFALLLGPVWYVIQIKYIGYGTAVLSDHAQSLGIAIMFYELMCFCDSHTLTAGNYARLSLAVFLSFGSAFTSVFPIFFLALTVAGLEVQYYLRQDAPGRALWRKTIIPKYLRLVLAVALPFLAMGLYYAIKGCLADFYYWAYEFNVTIYSKYQDTGGSALQSLFAGFGHMLAPLQSVNLHDSSLLRAELTVAAFASFILLGVVHRSAIVTVGLFLMLNACETRGDIGAFHAVHAVMLQCAAVGCAAGWLAERIKSRPLRWCACLAVLVMVIYPARQDLRYIHHITLPDCPQPGSVNHVVDVITDDGDRIGNSTLAESIYIDSRTIPASITSAGVKWAWDGASEQAMAQLRADPPKVYVLDRGYSLWGYAIADYAADLIAFIDENYTPLDKYLQNTVYVLNSYYDEACRRLDALYGRVALDPMGQVTAFVDRQEMIDGKLYLQGWGILPDGAVGASRTYVYLRHGGRELGLFRTLPYDRPDIGAIYGPAFVKSGFMAIVDVDDALNADDIDVTVVIEDDAGLHTDRAGRSALRHYVTNPNRLLSLVEDGALSQ